MSFMGVVLAGGESKRMGSDKALLTLNGENMLSRTVRCLQQANAEDVIISRNKPSEPGLRDIHAQAIRPLENQHLLNTNHPDQWQQAQQALQTNNHAAHKET
jgi:molybdopterin-guanine dinucleotide biosynthesis protein A